MLLPSRKMMQRKPSHFGSYCQPPSDGICSTERDSMGGKGGFIVKPILGERVRSYLRTCIKKAGVLGQPLCATRGRMVDTSSRGPSCRVGRWKQLFQIERKRDACSRRSSISMPDATM